MRITFNELRQLKDSLPNGSMHKIANDLGFAVDTVRNYFGGANYERGQAVGIHYEAGPYGGIVDLPDTSILELAKELVLSEVEVMC